MAAPDVNVSEAVNLDEALDAGGTPGALSDVSIGEAVNIDEALTKSAQHLLALAENVALSEALTVVGGLIEVDLAESVDYQEAEAVRDSELLQLIESVGLAESMSFAPRHAQVLAENVPYAESFSFLASSPIIANIDVRGGVFVGNRVRIFGKFTDIYGNPLDPVDVVLLVLRPDSADPLAYSGGSFTRPEVGSYFVDLLLDVAGRFVFDWRSVSGGETAYVESVLTVKPRLIP